jgi:hypothetical protein
VGHRRGDERLGVYWRRDITEEDIRREIEREDKRV